jgi:ABC-type lipoprotein release transport system permease subunit
MRLSQLIRLSLRHYWRTNVAVVLGVAVAVMVLSGALLVGDSVRGSLKDLVLERIGRTDLVVLAPTFFQERLASDLKADSGFATHFAEVVPIVVVEGVAVDQASGRRAARVQVYGVDDRFWRFHHLGHVSGPAGRELLLSPALAREIGATEAQTVLVRVQKPSAIPLETLHGRKDDLGRTLRLTVKQVLSPADLGEFSLRPQQGDVRAAFVPLSRLQQDLDVRTRVNALLVASVPGTGSVTALEALLRQRATLEDIGVRLRVVAAERLLSFESEGGLIDDARAERVTAVATAMGIRPEPVLTYLVNGMRIGEREIPYSLVTGVDLQTIVPDLRAEETSHPPIVLNEWAARDLQARVGDEVTLDYMVWVDPGRLVDQQAKFQVEAIVPIAGAAADRDFAPDYPGITESTTLRDWDPPFPLDLRRVRPIDEDYWSRYRTTPKAFIATEIGRSLWRSRYGSLTSIRLSPPEGMAIGAARDAIGERLRAAFDPTAFGLSVRDIRTEGLAASRGATDFGEYFAYFSFFLVVSAITLASLFFKLGVEQRVREVGLLRAVGFSPRTVRTLFLKEGLALAFVGSLIGAAGAILYGALMMAGLRTWWVDAVGTTSLRLHVSPISLLLGVAGGIVAALACIWWTLRTLARISERSLLAGQIVSDDPAPSRAGRLTPGVSGLACLAMGILMLAAGSLGWVARTGAFFGAGALLLGACLFGAARQLRRTPRTAISGRGWWPIVRLGVRSATYRPGRTVLSIAVVAAAAFILISVDAFRRDPSAASADRHSGTGGFALIVDTVVPLVTDPGGAEGLEQLGLASEPNVRVTPLRVLPGDDASCLNLYEPRQPRIVAVSHEFIAEGRFRFQNALDRSDEERVNPWLLLEREQRDDEGEATPAGAPIVPVIADANSLTYVLHKGLGDEVTFELNGRPIRLRVVAALADSVLQGELVMSDAHFKSLFPDEPGYRMLMIEAPADRAPDLARVIEDRLSDFGADATSTTERLAEFHRVENTYLSTFQTLGGLGLLLGTVGLAAVLMRNVLERRRELALLGAVGFGRRRLLLIVMTESLLMLVVGLGVGTACALVAIMPAVLERGGRLPTGTAATVTLIAVFVTGLLASAVATRAAMHARLLDSLRSE